MKIKNLLSDTRRELKIYFAVIALTALALNVIKLSWIIFTNIVFYSANAYWP